MGEQRTISQKFRNRYGSDARTFRAPGRINLIGEHTDYNEGFVLPAAIDFHTWVAIAPRNDRKLVLYSENFEEAVETSLDDHTTAKQHWSDYVRGVALKLEEAGHRLTGANLLIRGNVPVGSGLSSSASLEVAVGTALLSASNLSIDRADLARVCQRAENEFVGARCGIMDQFISCHGKADHALMLDCRSLEYAVLPLPQDVSLVACNTMVRHQVAGGEYNKRRAECEEGVHLLSRTLPGITALRDVCPEQLQHHAHEFPDLIYRRCRHIVTENDRVTQAASSLKTENFSKFGQLMAESHRSLRDDFEVSCQELDWMVELANQEDGVIGSRMTGGGFGGCTVNLVHSDKVEQFCNNVSEGYRDKTGQTPEIYVSRAAAGAQEVQ
ncbi:MAG TPA: galactokinase [Terriglobales bacterium]|nr:galactokinase [Terriglobales bacterium]